MIKVFEVDKAQKVTARGGEMRVVVWPKVGAKNLTLHYCILKPGESFENHSHKESEDVFTFIRGQGVVRSNNKTYPVREGVVVYVPPGVPHEVINTGTDILVVVGSQSPPDIELYKKAKLL